MKNDSTTHSSTHSHRVMSAFRNSIIISALDRFCCLIYEMLSTGIFAKIFSGQKKTSLSTDESQNTKSYGPLSKLREWTAQKIENAKLVNAVNSCASNLLICRLRVIGTYLLSFALYTGLFAFIAVFLSNKALVRHTAYVRLVEALTLGAVSVPFIVSRQTLSSALKRSKICTKLLEALGFSVNKFDMQGKGGRYVTAFIFGMLSGIASVKVSPLFIIVGLFALLYVYAVLAVPEFGVMSLFFLMPFAPTMALAGLTIFVTGAFALKIIRKKRVLSLARIDFIALIFAFLLLCAGFVSLSTKSIAPSLVFVCFMAGYFLVSCCMRSEEWLTKCINALIFSALLVAFYGIIQYVLGGSGSTKWLDSDLFENIAGRAVSTLENPNMLGEYLILIIPIAAAVWMTGHGMPRKNSFCCAACLSMCLILTWSRGAWLGFILSVLILLLIWNRRSVWIIVGGLLALPFATLVLPDSIISRFTSIGNMADTSTSYRVGIWRGAMHMLNDHLFSGIGIGEGAWKVLYPDYTLPGIEAAPHSHNLFIQIGLESGIFGLAVFLIFIFLLARMCFTLFSRMSDSKLAEGAKYKMLAAGPLCGIIAVLCQGLTDYSWYNYRVYLMFWLVAGLIPAIVKSADRSVAASSCAGISSEKNDDTEASINIKISSDDTGDKRS